MRAKLHVTRSEDAAGFKDNDTYVNDAATSTWKTRKIAEW